MRVAWTLSVLVVMCVKVGPALATPGAHPALLSTADVRSSSVVLTYRQGLGPLAPRMLSYNANFTATSGNFSAQFGAHVLQLKEIEAGNTMYGAAATGAAVMSFPLARRFGTGVPRSAFLVYAGAAPTAAISGQRNFLNVPIGIGVALPVSPAAWLTVSPWFEAAPGLDFDTTIHDPDLSEYEPDEADLQQVLNGQEAVLFSEDDLRDVIDDSIETDLAFEVPLRAGLDVTARISEAWSINLNSYLTSLGTAFGGTKLVYLGAGVSFHWDSIVPSILPPQRRLLNESCEDIEARFRMCPAARGLSNSVAPGGSAVPTAPVNIVPASSDTDAAPAPNSASDASAVPGVTQPPTPSQSETDSAPPVRSFPPASSPSDAAQPLAPETPRPADEGSAPEDEPAPASLPSTLSPY